MMTIKYKFYALLKQLNVRVMMRHMFFFQNINLILKYILISSKIAISSYFNEKKTEKTIISSQSRSQNYQVS